MTRLVTRPRAALLALLLLATACASDGAVDPDGRPVLTVGLMAFVGYAPLYVAEELDVCERHGLSLRLVDSSDQAGLDALLAAGHVDVGTYGNTSLVFANGAGIPLRATLTLDYSVGADAVVGRDVRSLADLSRRGLRVAADESDISYFLLMATAERQGLAVTDFNHVQMPSTEVLAAFAGGSVDAIGASEPALSEALRVDGAELLASTSDDLGLISDVFAARPEVIDDRRRELRALADCWYDTLEVLRTDRSRAEEIIARRLGVRPAEVDALTATVRWPDRAEGTEYLHGGRFEATVEFAGELYGRLGLVEDLPPAAELVGPR